MDTYPDDAYIEQVDTSLSYNIDVPYDEQVDTSLTNDAPGGGLASRIGANKLYLLAETSASGTAARIGKGKRKRGDGEEEDAMEDQNVEDDVDMDGNSVTRRPNAILLRGTPISHLSTARIFSYATHFDLTPIGLEWIDDTTCVLVFATNSLSKAAHRALQKPAVEEPDDDGCVTARPIPVTLWPPEERINKSLGMSDGLKGDIKMRWARVDDVKKPGARKESKFYRKHGESAGREVYSSTREPSLDETIIDLGSRKRSRQDESHRIDADEKRRILDAELDNFLADDSDRSLEMDFDSASRLPRLPQSRKRLANTLDDNHSARSPSYSSDTRIANSLSDRMGRVRTTSPPPSTMRADYIEELQFASTDRSPPSKMRSDYIKSDGRTLLERTSVIRAQPLEGGHEWDSDRKREERPVRPLPTRRERRGERGGERGKRERASKSQQELDDELDAFLNDRE